ncbi:hypothetical protein P4661_25890 [Priestia megaterium]|uniref:hypothetical protein n=1 Tax=Priestia megaterium TaxID=1404 RepID=UPI002E1F9594|nr:hypothetical protein [Priestia megaterium]
MLFVLLGYGTFFYSKVGRAVNILTVVSMIFAAGIFTEIIDGTGIVKDMADTLIAVIPDALGLKISSNCHPCKYVIHIYYGKCSLLF